MFHPKTLFLTTIAIIAFAGNSLLCRIALKTTGIDAASFTTVRLVSGALMLWLVAKLVRGGVKGAGSWLSALALFVYAAAFSFAYVSLTAATGALLLFGAVQATMIGHGLWRGERLVRAQWLGFALALGGLAVLLLPGLSAPPLKGALLMLGAGAAWGVYSLRGKGGGDPLRASAGNFLRAAPLAVILSAGLMVMFQGHGLGHVVLPRAGIVYALASGMLASGAGYIVWYKVLPALQSTHAGAVQLSVPVLAATGGVLFLGEGVTLRLVLASTAILGGIALVIAERG